MEAQHLLPIFLEGRVEQNTYTRWLQVKVTSHLKRDKRERTNAHHDQVVPFTFYFSHFYFFTLFTAATIYPLYFYGGGCSFIERTFFCRSL